MSVVIVGGNECMVREYQDLCREYSCKSKVYPKMCNSIKKIGCPDLLVLFTNTVSHKMIHCVLNNAKATSTKIVRSHSSSLSSLRNILSEHV